MEVQEDVMAGNPLDALAKLDPEMLEHLKAGDRFVFADGALSAKVKLLIALAFDAAHGASEGVTALAERAAKAGATSAEIAEAVRVAWHLTGVGSLYTASRGLGGSAEPAPGRP
jgi:alkylhydroperoxidase/carboxymuconolactone decarboxylase family protein YurZ